MEKLTKQTVEKSSGIGPIEYEISQRGGTDGDWENVSTGEYTEFLYVLQGGYDLRLGGEVYTLPAGSMVLLDGRESYSIKGRRKKRAVMSLKILPEVLFGSDLTGVEGRVILDLATDGGDRRIFTPDMPLAPFIRGVFERIRDEYTERKFGYRLAVRGEVTRLFTAVIRYLYEDGTKKEETTTAGARMLVRKARQYVEEKYPEATLSSAASACGVSYSYFSRVFKDTMRTSFSDYLNRVRINRSLSALVSTDDSITDIALSVGFSSTSYYIQTFKRMKGCSPNKYRKMTEEERGR